MKLEDAELREGPAHATLIRIDGASLPPCTDAKISFKGNGKFLVLTMNAGLSERVRFRLFLSLCLNFDLMVP